ncbi:MAG: hypothetical protein HY962_02950 [Ignavibacteriae bacterium]|jgi:hypothetical protein|nr:hypothetical protein [Ignavibacteriota bacterium]
MRLRQHYFSFIAALIVLVSGISGCSFTTAHFEEATLARSIGENKEPIERVQSFHRCDRTMYCTVKMANTPQDTKVKAVWRHLPEGGSAEILDSSEVTVASDVWIAFHLAISRDGWVYGKYSVELFIDGKSAQTLSFNVEPMFKDGLIREATIASAVGEDQYPQDRTATFATTPAVVYAVINTADAPEGSVFSARWYAKDAAGTQQDIVSTDFPFAGSGWIAFSLRPSGNFPPGTYYCDIAVNGTTANTQSFTIGTP